jgi:hypothetical protein
MFIRHIERNAGYVRKQRNAATVLRAKYEAETTCLSYIIIQKRN